MRQVTLPLTAMILAPGRCCVGDLTVGDRVGGYDLRQRQPTLARITGIEPLLSQEIVVTFTRYRTVSFVWDSVGLTVAGEWPLNKTNTLIRYMGYCTENPRAGIDRAVEVVSYGTNLIKAAHLTWEGPNHIWSNGILVGQ